jgi:WD40 repeat protein
LQSYAFNQDHSCFVCGTTAGFRVYSVFPVGEVHRRENTAAFQHRSVVLAAMLFKTNIFAMVTLSEDDPANGGLTKVQIWDDQKGRFVGELRSRYEVKGVVLRRDIIAMVCEYSIYVYTCDKLRVILHLTTKDNNRGLCVLAAASSPWILCCPGQLLGEVRVQVGQDDTATHTFVAHQTALAALAITASGHMVATASETGTVVKVFSTKEGQLLYRLRRSVTRPAAISCLTFRPDDRFLAVATSSATVHIFWLDPAAAMSSKEGDAAGDASPSPALGPAPDPPLPPEGVSAPIEQLASQVQKAVGRVSSAAAAETVGDIVRLTSDSLVPKVFKDTKSFALFRLPDVDSNGQPAVDARSKQSRILGPHVAFHATEPRLFVLHYNGVLYECSFKPDHDINVNGVQELGLASATTWFAVRPDFRLQGPCTQVVTVAGGAQEDDEEAEEWQLL